MRSFKEIMPFSFSNIGTAALLLMIATLMAAELVKKIRHTAHSKKQVSSNAIGK